MTVKELVSTHQRVRERHANVDVTVSIFKTNEEYPDVSSPQEAIKIYGDCEVECWYQTSECTDKVLIDISIMV